MAELGFLGFCPADYCPDQPWQSKLRAECMANCLAFLGNLTPGYLRQHRVLPEIASYGRHCDTCPRPRLLCFCYRALVRTLSPTPTCAQFEITEGR